MARINLTKTVEKELKTLAKDNGYDSYEKYIEDRVVTMLVNELTAADVETTKQQIQGLQDKLNKKREEILLELKEEKLKGGEN